MWIYVEEPEVDDRFWLDLVFCSASLWYSDQQCLKMKEDLKLPFPLSLQAGLSTQVVLLSQDSVTGLECLVIKDATKFSIQCRIFKGASVGPVLDSQQTS